MITRSLRLASYRNLTQVSRPCFGSPATTYRNHATLNNIGLTSLGIGIWRKVLFFTWDACQRLLLVKKPDGGYRICIDYRKLNAVTVKDKYPLPNPSMIFDRLSGCQFFSKLDLRWAYYQVRVAEEDVHKTTFRSPLGSFASRVMSMGLTNAAPTFQRLMDSMFGDSMIWTLCPAIWMMS